MIDGCELRLLKDSDVTRASRPCVWRGVEEIVDFSVFRNLQHGPEARVTIVPPDCGVFQTSQFSISILYSLSARGDSAMPEPTSLAGLTEIALKFRTERDWQQFHNPKDVALSMSLEVAELVEIMQWRNGAELLSHLKKEREHVGQELSDILGWVLLLAHDLEVDLPAAFVAKMQQNAEKYPVEKAKGIAKKYTEL